MKALKPGNPCLLYIHRNSKMTRAVMIPQQSRAFRAILVISKPPAAALWPKSGFSSINQEWVKEKTAEMGYPPT
jgi:hypothetical protein